MRQWWSARRKATANDSNSSKVHRREGQLATVPIKPGIFTLPRCTSAESLFYCCDSVAALALANCNQHVAEASILRLHPPIPSVENHLVFAFWIHARAPPEFLISRAKLKH
jgi:hypothetical protein